MLQSIWSKLVLLLIYQWRVDNSCARSKAFPLPHNWLQYWWDKSKMLLMAECHPNVMNIHWDLRINLPEWLLHPLYPLFTDTQSIRFYWQQHTSIETRMSLVWVFVDAEVYIPHAEKNKKAEEKEGKKCNGKYSGHCLITGKLGSSSSSWSRFCYGLRCWGAKYK